MVSFLYHKNSAFMLFVLESLMIRVYKRLNNILMSILYFFFCQIQAVCCSDKLHCCPSGSICDVAQGKCNMSGIVSTWSAKHLAKPAPVVNDVVCPDHSSCPSDYTCCESQQGDYACCPLPEVNVFSL